MTTSLIVVCTHGRPGEVRALGELLAGIRGGRDVLVVDSSPDDGTDVVCRAFPFVEYRRAERASVAFQRNRGIERARRRGVDVVHFVDDDSRPSPTYFDELERALRATGAAGVGGIVTSLRPAPPWPWLTALFLLDSRRAGVVLASGRASVGHRPGGGGEVEWLPGSAMSYRLTAIGDLRFDERLSGHSWGEDRDFSYRLGRRHRLWVCPTALSHHRWSPVHRASPRDSARERVPIQHRWVVENRRHGMRRSAFWWSVAGETLLRGVAATLTRGPRRARHRAVLRGVVDGVVDVLRGHGPAPGGRP